MHDFAEELGMLENWERRGQGWVVWVLVVACENIN
jgi:hypothetical protein